MASHISYSILYLRPIQVFITSQTIRELKINVDLI